MRWTPPIVPDGFWDHQTIKRAVAAQHFGWLLRGYRYHPYWGGMIICQQDLAGYLRHSQQWVSSWEKADEPPQACTEWLTQIADLLVMPARVRWWWSAGEEDQEEVSSTERREFLGVTALGMVGVTLPNFGVTQSALQPAQTGAVTIDRVEAEILALGREFRTGNGLAQIAARVNPLHTAVVGWLNGPLNAKTRTRWERAAARLAFLIGGIHFLRGEFRSATQWRELARKTALGVGDQYTADIAVSGLCLVPIYEGRPQDVLRLTEPRLSQLGQAAATPAHAYLWSMSARAHAILGQAAEFDRAIGNAHECLQRSPARLIAPSILSFPPERLGYCQGRGEVALGRNEMALATTAETLTLYDPAERIDRALVILDQAVALIPQDTPEALKVALSALALPATRGASLQLSARHLVHFPAGSPENRDWQEALRNLTLAA